MPPNYWVIKSEPSEYSYEQLTKDKKTVWTGVRNFEARKNIRSMKPGDLALYYHSGDGKEIVGIARVASDPKEDPTAKGEDWASVDMEPFLALKKSVPLAELKATASLKDFPSVRKPRLSVAPVTPEQFEQVLKLAQTRLP